MITNIDIDETIVAQAMQLSGARTKREVVDRALRELVARATRPSVRELFGIGGVEANYDPKAPWATGSDAGQRRIQHSVHEPAANYNVTPKKPTPKARAKKA
ncbi:MAG: type II toxin-antitoxin system VapB family antitoxin [Polaromonas sp.]